VSWERFTAMLARGTLYAIDSHLVSPDPLGNDRFKEMSSIAKLDTVIYNRRLYNIPECTVYDLVSLLSSMHMHFYITNNTP
jgi:hypothetical protein